MKLLIDNLDGLGLQDYTAFVGMNPSPAIRRRLNRPSEMKFGLSLSEALPAIPALGGRVVLVLAGGSDLFTGYIFQTPTLVYVGLGDHGAIYQCDINALSDAMLLDQKAPPSHPPFINRSAGNAFAQLVAEALPNWFGTTGIENGDAIPYYSVDPAKKWTSLAEEVALAGGCCYRDLGGELYFSPLAAVVYPLAESSSVFSPKDLKLQSENRVVNDLTILGPEEPGAHVKDFFVGDGQSTKFYMSQKPFSRSSQVALYNRTILDEVYSELDPTHWSVTDRLAVISVNQGQLQVDGGTGIDGETLLTFIEQIELGGTTVIEHGDMIFNAASDSVIGGLYAGTITIAGCLAGFRVLPSGSNCTIQPLVGGSVSGTTLETQAGHHYVFTTQVYPTEAYRMQQVFHSSVHPSGVPRGGDGVAADVRVVLEIQDIDPGNPATQITPATVLYDGVISNAPAFCSYALINAGELHVDVAFTYIYLPVDALVRRTLPGESTATALTGSLRQGAQCQVSSSPSLQFYPEYIPAANELIEVSYRGQSHAAARVIDSGSILAHSRGGDDGVRGSIREIGMPLPRTSQDCETAALALMDDAGQGWAGEYKTWTQTLPGGAIDIFPGDGLAIDIPSRAASFTSIVREVDMTISDLAGENSRYILRFVDVGDPSLDFAFVTALVKQRQVLNPIDVSLIGNAYISDLTKADFTNVTSTTVTIDAGTAPIPGGGIEVRYTDLGWGADNNRNLIGRFTTSSFSLTRYARAQSYFLRSYDNSVPAKYSRYSAVLHVDYPL
jgi:hypothetical protein